MRAFVRLSACSIGLIAACSAGTAGLYVAAVVLAIPQIPPWGQGPTWAWVFDVPGQAAGGNSGSLPEGGYSGPVSFLCQLPPEFGYLTDVYGALRPGGFVHQGIDYGTYHQPVDVRTPFGGQVIYTGWLRLFGNAVVIENAGYRVYLAHHSALLVQAGQVVEAGETVAVSGSTGNSTGIHVHFEVRVWNGGAWTPVNPLATLLPGQDAPCDWYNLAIPQPPA